MYGQSECGTEISESYYKDKLAQMGTNNNYRTAAAPILDRKLTITAWLFDSGLGQVPNDREEDINAAIDTLNIIFEPIGLEFEICAFTAIPNHEMNTFVDETYLEEALAVYYQPNTINMYFPDEITRSGGMVGGFAYMPGGPDAVFIASPDNNMDGFGEISYKTIAHEMGHYFGLFHTFEPIFGTEFAGNIPTSNCETTGDLICDTEADPYDEDDPPAFDTLGCNLAVSLMDPNGEWYVPPTNNLMSYYPQECRCIFTNEQYNVMANVYVNERTYLW